MLAFGCLFLAIISVSKAVSIEKEHSLIPPYVAGGENLENWDLTGSAQLGDAYIRLTPDEEKKQGAIWNHLPCFSNNWEFHVHFQIHGKGVYLNGDGIALWYVKESDMLQNGPVFGSKDYFTGLGVFIDTFANQGEAHKHRHPYISAMVNNGSLHYEPDEDGTMTQIGGCHAFIRNLEVPTKIAVSYINKNLAIYLDHEGRGHWTLCFKHVGVHLPTGYFFGISASTSHVSDNHDILAVTSLNMGSDDMEWEDRSDVIPKAENIEIPQKYYKEFIKQELQKGEKKEEIWEEEEELQKVEKKREIREEEEEEEDEWEEVEEEEKKQTKARESPTEEISPRTPLIRKLVYITGAAAIILVAISVFKKYYERRRVRMEKRLY